MKQLENWFLKNDLFINITETAAMSFHLCRSKPPVKSHILLQNNEVQYMPQVKFLGMHITENLSWHAHICSLCHKCFGIFTSPIFTCDLGTVLYFGGGGTKESIKVLHIQKKVIRLITGINKYASCRQKFKENRNLTVTAKYVLEVLCYIKKYEGD